MDIVLQAQLLELLRREETLWKDKAKARWYEEGDSNTRYFHLTTIIHRKSNAINRVQLSDTYWATKHEEIGDAFVQYYTNLFTTSSPHFP